MHAIIHVILQTPLIVVFGMYLFWSGRLTVQLCVDAARNSYAAAYDGVTALRKIFRRWRSNKS
jgi:hypothetical protein